MISPVSEESDFLESIPLEGESLINFPRVLFALLFNDLETFWRRRFALDAAYSRWRLRLRENFDAAFKAAAPKMHLMNFSVCFTKTYENIMNSTQNLKSKLEYLKQQKVY